MRGYEGITVSGTHGKTTTTAMLATVLTAADLDPTVVVGSFVATLGGNARVGRGPLFLAEACEYQRAFLHYTPRTIVLTNIEPDHLDTYGTFGRLIRAFTRYVERLPADGHLVANADDPVVRRVAAAARCPVSWFPAQPYPVVPLELPGAHNQANASAAIATAALYGVPESQARHALAFFAGSWRRFEILGTYRGVTVVDDYAHHPTAIRATIEAARERFPNRRIVVLFEPHHEHRTRVLLNGFAAAFDRADRVVLAPIYRVAGRERGGRKPIESADLARRLARRGVRVRVLPVLSAAAQVLPHTVRSGDVLLVMGAGTVTSVAHQARRILRPGVL
jgi:UDP-N-acetylmuramate--alanine ligase